jgi:hypothetical protein
VRLGLAQVTFCASDFSKDVQRTTFFAPHAQLANQMVRLLALGFCLGQFAGHQRGFGQVRMQLWNIITGLSLGKMFLADAQVLLGLLNRLAIFDCAIARCMPCYL